MAALFAIKHTQTFGSILVNLSVLPDWEKAYMGVAVQIFLLSCTLGEVYNIAYVLPVNGGHV